MNSPKVIDESVEFKIPRALQQFNPQNPKHKFKCTCCGKGFSVQKGNFQKSNSPLFQSNDGFLPWCKECTDKYVNILTAFYSGNEEHAIGHFCQQADWVYELEVLKMAKEISGDRSRISHYAAKKNLNVDGRKTYCDSIKYNYKLNQYNIIQSKEQVKSENYSVSGAAVDRWGVGFTEIDYKNLDDHYRMLKNNNPNCDSNQEIFIKSLCNLNMLMVRALKDGDSDKYVKLSEQYSKTFTKAGLKTVEEKDSSNDETFCMTLGFISEYTPEEFYKDKKLYEDWDNIGEYIDRHITRPMINLETGSDIRDKEFYVPNEDEYEDE
ncbi:hypothetical protein H8S37_04580 [Mediterraneibacter sp. NSJ-55]|uniref:Uncharacterized protein n=1 Tax=Mediterraneibacter hominis TaxID=2763054 RepID=A0A923LH54_9FIRM|nr:hypothetical protein [Mediterraneibacter hominis]MBC5688204.1 hypothetical protein [Mediterraneibacter hominis]